MPPPLIALASPETLIANRVKESLFLLNSSKDQLKAPNNVPQEPKEVRKIYTATNTVNSGLLEQSSFDRISRQANKEQTTSNCS